LFEEDFEGGSFSDRILPSDRWELGRARRDSQRVGVLRGTSEDRESLSFPYSDSWGPYTLELVARFDGSGAFQFSSHANLYVDDCLTGHSFSFVAADESLLATSTDQECDQDKVFEEEGSIETDEWYVLMFFVSNEGFAVALDGELLFNEETDRVPNGVLTLNLLEGMSMEIDSLSVLSGLDGLESGDKLGSLGAITLRDHDARYQDAVAELIDLGLIPQQGRLLFQEDYVFFTGSGGWFIPLAEGSPRRNVVMAAELTFTASSPRTEEAESCALSSRITRDSRGRVDEYLDVLLLSDGEISVDDVGTGRLQNRYDLDLDLSYDRPYHLLYIVQDETITVFIDGELVMEESPVTDRSGFFGLSLFGKSAEARCEGRNLWVYSLD
jgi:hypothetical protein